MDVLAPRFRNDGRAVIPLTPAQREAIACFRKKSYDYEAAPCINCGADGDTVIAEKDRYGLECRIAVCRRCGLVRTDPRLASGSLIGFYSDDHQSIYTPETISADDFFQEQVAKGRIVLEYISRSAGLLISNARVLEIGCGAGGILSVFQRAGHAVEGIDLASELISWGAPKGVNIGIGALDATFSRSRQRAFDLVIMADVLEHLPDPVSALRLVNSMLRPHGCVFICVPGIKNLRNSYDCDLLKYLQNAHLWHFSLASLGGLLRRSGFEMISADEGVFSLSRNVVGELRSDITRPTDQAEHDHVLAYLNDLENHRFRYRLRMQVRTSTISTLRKIGLLPAVQRLRGNS